MHEEVGNLNAWAKQKVGGVTKQTYDVHVHTGTLIPVEVSLSKYRLRSGETLLEKVQVVALIPMRGPEFYLALCDDQGNWVAESRWKQSDFWGLVSHGVGSFLIPGGWD